MLCLGAHNILSPTCYNSPNNTEYTLTCQVRFANTHAIPFIAFSGGHGGISSLAGVKNGIQVHMRRLNSIKVSQDGTYATIGGGAKGKEVRNALWEIGKWTVHGVCECVGLTAVALGGGHGLLQGRYGLLSDQIISLEMILANGTAIQVSSSSNPDLFWAVQGAGHSFGIVTSINYRIYDIPDSEEEGRIWSYEVLVWEATAANVKSVYGVAKELLEIGTQPDGLLMYGVLGMDPGGSGKVVIMHHIVYSGPLTALSRFTAPYHALNITLLSSTSEEGTYLDVPRFIRVDESGIPCRMSDVVPGAGVLRFPVDVHTYNLDALAEMTKKFIDLIHSREDFAGSFVMVEQYPTRAVRAADRSKSAIPWRDNVLLIAPALLYPALDMTSTPPKPNDELAELALRSGEQLRRILVDGAKHTGGHFSYVNYAYGGEHEKEVYGEENIEKLKKLKKIYDPNGRFKFYAPIGNGQKDNVRERDEL